MDRFHGLPEPVAHTVRTYLNLLEVHGVSFVEGLYLIGSVALNGYQDGKSDIDVVGLLSGTPDQDDISRLARVHADLKGSGGPAFDGFYVQPDLLRRTPDSGKPVPFSLDGIFYPSGPCFEVNPVTRLCLARHGIAIRGPAPSALRIATSRPDVRHFLLRNLATYWSTWITDTEAALARKGLEEKVSADVLAWGVLGTARIECTLRTGRIVSKAEAGRWGLSTYAPRWHPVLQDAMLARRSKLSHVPVRLAAQALDFMRLVVSHDHP